MKEKIIIWGNSDFAKLMYIYLKEDNKYEICGFMVDDDYIKDKTFCDLKVIPFSKIFEYSISEYKFLVAIGYQKINTIRENIYKRLKNLGYKCISYVHKTATLPPDFKLNENCIIFENVVVQACCEIGENTIIFGGSVICHSAVIGENCFIASNVCVNGYTKVGNNTFLGAGSIIRDKLIIGAINLIGAGCCILSATEDEYVCKSDKNIPIIFESKDVKI